MIHNYPFFGFPNYLNRTQKNYYSNNSVTQTPHINDYHSPQSLYINNYNTNNIPQVKSCRNNYYNNYKNVTAYSSNKESSFVKTQSKTSSVNNNESSFLNLFGISLNFDDVLLICVILFLFYENTDDYYLLFALVLLLLG